MEKKQGKRVKDISRKEFFEDNPTTENYSSRGFSVLHHPLKESKFKFCPHCGHLLVVKASSAGEFVYRYKCGACPYVRPIRTRKKFCFFEAPDGDSGDEIIDSEKANDHRQRTEILCPKCDHKEAFFYQMQTRSADEPMTTFYTCCNMSCKYNWRD